jgi:hypothetical protein
LEEERDQWVSKPVVVPESVAEEVLEWFDTYEPVIAAPRPECASTIAPLYALSREDDFQLIEYKNLFETREEVDDFSNRVVERHEEFVDKSVKFLNETFLNVTRVKDAEDEKTKTFPCTRCSSVFKSQVSLASHTLFTHKDKSEYTYRCTNCDTGYVRR